MIIFEHYVKCRERKPDMASSRVQDLLNEVGANKEEIEDLKKKQQAEEIAPSSSKKDLKEEQIEGSFIQESTATVGTQKNNLNEDPVIDESSEAGETLEVAGSPPATETATQGPKEAGPNPTGPSYPFFTWVQVGIQNLADTVPDALSTMKSAFGSLKQAFFGWVYGKDIAKVDELLHGENKLTEDNADDSLNSGDFKILEKFYKHDIKRSLITKDDLSNIEKIVKSVQGEKFKPYEEKAAKAERSEPEEGPKNAAP